MDFTAVIDNLPLYLSGLNVTIQLLLGSLLCGLLLALPLGVAAASQALVAACVAARVYLFHARHAVVGADVFDLLRLGAI